MPIRCVNIDWLEVFAREPVNEPHNAQYFLSNGVYSKQREYGTRMYAEMFTLEDEHGNEFIEVRRAPLSLRLQGGLYDSNICHLRLVNRQCYRNDAVAAMRQFCNRFGYQVERISRIDICLDFEKFDDGTDPQKFIRRYMKGSYSKVNQANVHAHGDDTFTARNWNSLSWGSKESQIGTKLYNKTLELEKVKDKPYIRQAWFAAGLIDNPLYLDKNIWRLEFSIRSSVKNWFCIQRNGNEKDHYSIRNNFEMYDSREKLLAIFDSLQQHYFDIRKNQDGKTKYECPKKELFKFTQNDSFYKIEHPSSALPRNYQDDILLKRLQQYKLKLWKGNEIAACELLIERLKEDDTRRLLDDPNSFTKLLALRQALAAKLGGADNDPVQLIANIVDQINASQYPLFEGNSHRVNK